MTTTNNTPSQRLRLALKAAGFNGRQVTVRYPSSTLYVTIRDSSVSLTKVSAIAGAFESVSRDHKTGDILCGGNTFVRVAYDDTLVDPVKATILAVLDPAPNDEYVALPGGFRAMKCTREHGGASHVWEVRMQGLCRYRHNRAAGSTSTMTLQWGLPGPPSGSRWRTLTPARSGPAAGARQSVAHQAMRLPRRRRRRARLDESPPRNS